MIRAVIDTNVLVSAMISPEGNEALLLLAINTGLVTPCYSASMLEEYSAVLQRAKFRFPAAAVEALVEMLRTRGEEVVPAQISHVSPDPEDDQFIASALAANADFLITGNKRHFPTENLPGIKVIGARELIERIASEI